MDKSKARAVSGALGEFGLRSLYEFLGLPRTASVSELYNAADAWYKMLRREGRADAASDTLQMLAGQAMAVFAGVDAKERYDNTLDEEAMAEFDGYLEVIGRDAYLEVGEIADVVRRAEEKGVSESVARGYILDYAARRKWGLESCSSAPAAPAEGQDVCSSCGNSIPAEDRFCGFCGCSQQVRDLFADGLRRLYRMDLEGAAGCFQEAESAGGKATEAAKEAIATVRSLKVAFSAEVEKLAEACVIDDMIRGETNGDVGINDVDDRTRLELANHIFGEQSVFAMDIIRGSGEDLTDLEVQETAHETGANQNESGSTKVCVAGLDGVRLRDVIATTLVANDVLAQAALGRWKELAEELPKRETVSSLAPVGSDVGRNGTCGDGENHSEEFGKWPDGDVIWAILGSVVGWLWEFIRTLVRTIYFLVRVVFYVILVVGCVGLLLIL